MLIPRHPDDPDQEDRYCGKPAVYDSADPKHSICAECFAELGDDEDLSREYFMSREALVEIASAAAKAIMPPLRGRVVVAVTDESGEFVGVGSNVGPADTEAILQAACFGADKAPHLVKALAPGRVRP
jgi:hypothetical protein